MSLKTRLSEEDFSGLAPVLQEHYEKPEGATEYLLRFEGKPAGWVQKDEVDSFRANNTKLLQEKQRLESLYQGIDPEAAKEAFKQLESLKEKEMFDKGKFEELLEAKSRPYKDQVKVLSERAALAEKRAAELQSAFQERQIKDQVLGEIMKIASPKKNTAEIIEMAVEKVWSFDEEGRMVPREGGKVLYGKSGDEVMTPAEWGARFVDSQRGNLFEDHTGGGSPRSATTSGVASKNPWAKGEGWNLTHQMQIARENPTLAAKLQAQAGH